MNKFTDASQPFAAKLSGDLPCGCAHERCRVARRLGAMAGDLVQAAHVVAATPDNPLTAELSVQCSRAATGTCHLLAIFHARGMSLTAPAAGSACATVH